MKKIFRISGFFIKLGISKIIAFFIKIFDKSKRNVWIISERGDDARDNGYFFYKYMVENRPEQPIWYVIKSSSADFSKIQRLGNWIEYGTFKHFVYYSLSKVRICSSMWGGDLPNGYYFNKFKNYMSRKRKFVYLKHGIYKDYDPSSMAEIFHPDFFCCGAYPEYLHIRDTYHHPKGVVEYTGLARFDNLHNIKTKNQILVMPTFRRWLQTEDKDYIKNSEYIKVYNELLNDKRVDKLLADNNLELIFYPHYVMQPYIDCFYTESSHIKIAKFKDYDVQTLLIESKLMVTDFSSVFFDFGYMDKPVIYYQFDRERYIKEHYDFTKGYFSYDDNGFGKVVFDNDTLVAEIEKSVNAQFVPEDEYKKRVSGFFPLKDDKNCDRIYKKISSLQNKG